MSFTQGCADAYVAAGGVDAGIGGFGCGGRAGGRYQKEGVFVRILSEFMIVATNYANFVRTVVICRCTVCSRSCDVQLLTCLPALVTRVAVRTTGVVPGQPEADIR